MNQPKVNPIWIQTTRYLHKIQPSGHTSYRKGRILCGIYLFASKRLTGYRSGFNPGFLAVRGRNWEKEKEGDMRSGFFGIPKGTLHYDEDNFSCALRELHEETGINLSLYPNSWEFIKEEQKGNKTLFYVELLDLQPFRCVVPLDQHEIEGIFWVEKDYTIPCEKWNSFSKRFLLKNEQSSEEDE